MGKWAKLLEFLKNTEGYSFDIFFTFALRY